MTVPTPTVGTSEPETSALHSTAFHVHVDMWRDGGVCNNRLYFHSSFTLCFTELFMYVSDFIILATLKDFQLQKDYSTYKSACSFQVAKPRLNPRPSNSSSFSVFRLCIKRLYVEEALLPVSSRFLPSRQNCDGRRRRAEEDQGGD